MERKSCSGNPGLEPSTCFLSGLLVDNINQIPGVIRSHKRVDVACSEIFKWFNLHHFHHVITSKKLSQMIKLGSRFSDFSHNLFTKQRCIFQPGTTTGHGSGPSGRALGDGPYGCLLPDASHDCGGEPALPMKNRCFSMFHGRFWGPGWTLGWTCEAGFCRADVEVRPKDPQPKRYRSVECFHPSTSTKSGAHLTARTVPRRSYCRSQDGKMFSWYSVMVLTVQDKLEFQVVFLVKSRVFFLNIGMSYSPGQPVLGDEKSRKRKIAMVAVPAASDLLATALAAIGIMYIPASVWQMLRGHP